jgi:AraC-like DNA-binding protein
VFVSSLVLQGILSEAHLRGVDTDALLRDAGVSKEVASAARASIDAASWGRVVDLAMLRLRDPGLGLTIGTEQLECTLQVFGYLLFSARTLQEAFDLSQRFLPLVVTGLHMDLVHVGSRSHLRFFCLGGLGENASRFGEELIAAVALRVAKRQRRELRLEVRFRQSRPTYSARLEAQFGRVTFDCEHSELVFERRCLQQLQPGTDPQVLHALVETAERLLLAQDRSASTSERVRFILARSPRLADANHRELAAQLRVGERALRRQLHAEGTTLRALIDEARCTLACHLLRLPAKTVAEVADELGFSEPSAFNRAFKRWTGLPPGEYVRAALRPLPNDAETKPAN